MEENKRKRFNVADFVSNEETPVETWHGEKVLIYNTNRVCHDDRCVCGDIVYAACSLLESWLKDGCYYGDRSDDKDLFFSVKKKTRTMTNRELAWWLMENPEEHREWKKIFDGKTATIHSEYVYLEGCEDKECDPEIVIRSNGGEWRVPEVEIKEAEVEEKEKPTVKLIPHKTRVKVEFDDGGYRAHTTLKIQSIKEEKDGSLITLEGDADLKFFLSKGEKKAEEFRRTFGEGVNEDNYNAVTKTTFTILD